MLLANQSKSASFAAVIAFALGGTCVSTTAQQIELVMQPIREYVLPTPEMLREVQIDSHSRQLVAMLDHPDYTTRETSARELLEHTRDKMQLYALLSDTGLTHEQRYRLLSVLREFVMSSPRGALGIQMQTINPGPLPGVRIEVVYQGMPAAAVLQPGDRITEVEDERITDTVHLQALVQARRPGDTVKLTVLRPMPDNLDNFQTMRVQLQLGSYDQLAGPDGLNTRNSTQVFRIREVEAAVRANSPPTQSVGVVGGAEKLLALRQRFVVEANPLDQHPLIQKLIAQKQLIAQGVIADSPELRQQWRRMFEQMLETAQAPDNGRTDWEEMKRLFERYSELIQE